MAYKNILIPIDGSALSVAALKHIVSIAEPQAHILLLMVVTLESSKEFSEGLALASGLGFGPMGNSWSADHDDAHIMQAREQYLNQLADKYRERDYNVSVQAVNGEIIDTIVNIAQQKNFDVIVMATHGRTGLAKLALGSVAEGVLHKATCPVLVIPARTLQH